MTPFRHAPIKPFLSDFRSVKYPSICLSLTTFGILLSLSPILQSYLHLPRRMTDVSRLEFSFHDPTYQNSLLLSAVMTIPMISDLLLDVTYALKRNSGEILHWSIRVLLLATLTVSNIAMYNHSFSNISPTDIYLCVTALRVTTAGGCISIFISVGDASMGAGWKAVALLTCFILGQNLLLYGRINPCDTTILPCAFMFLSIAGVILAQYSTLKFYTLWTTEARLTTNDLCFIFYLSAIALCSICGLVLSSECGTFNPLNYSPECLVSFEYLQMGFLVFVMVLPGRIVRYKLDITINLMKERQAFMRYISHEIRTPLNTVFLGMTFVQSTLNKRALTSDGVPDNSDILLETMDDMSSSCQTALNILNELLTFDKIDSGLMKMELEEAHPWLYVHGAVRPFAVQARQNNIHFNVLCEGMTSGWTHSTILHVDQHKMSQVLRNLISNAMKFTKPGGSVTVTAKHRTARQETSDPKVYWWRHSSSVEPESVTANTGYPSLQILRIEITDTGAGISMANQTKLFGQYVQFHASKLQNGAGSGLGLWIAKGIVELHGGTIGVTSEGEGHGCTFFIELPLYSRSTLADSGDILIKNDRSLGRSTSHDNMAGDVRRSHGISTRKGLGPTRNVEITGGRNQTSRFQTSRGIGTGACAGVSVSMARGRRRDSESFADTTGHLLSGGLTVDPVSRSSILCLPPNINTSTVQYPSLKDAVMAVLARTDTRTSSVLTPHRPSAPNPNPNSQSQSRHRGRNSASQLLSPFSLRPDATNGFAMNVPLQLRAYPKSDNNLVSKGMYTDKDRTYSFNMTSAKRKEINEKEEEEVVVRDGKREKERETMVKGEVEECRDYCQQEARNAEKSVIDFNTVKNSVSPPLPLPLSSTSCPNPYPTSESLSGNSSPFRGVSCSGLSTLGISPPSSPSIQHKRVLFCTENSPNIANKSADPVSASAARVLKLMLPVSADAKCSMTSVALPMLVPSNRRQSTNLWDDRGNRDGLLGTVSDSTHLGSYPLTSTLTVWRDESSGSTALNTERAYNSADGLVSIITELPSKMEVYFADAVPVHLTFLITDDSPATRKIIKRVLQLEGHTVHEAVDGKDCLVVVEREQRNGTPIDIILMDSEMPNMSGPAAASALRLSGYSGIVCGVTGNICEEDVKYFLLCGATFVLPKPLDLEALRSLIPQLH